MTHETTLGSVKLVINYENGLSGLELGTILMEHNNGQYANVTDLIWELSNQYGKVSFLEKAEQEIEQSINDKPSYLNED